MSLLAGCVLGLTAAWAGPVDAYGFGAAAIGRGNGGVAVPDGGLTAFRNPALLQDLSWAEATLGYAFNRSAFPAPPPLHWDTNRDGIVDETDAPLLLEGESSSADGMMIGMARNVGSKAGLAFNAFMPSAQFLRLRTTEPALPAWVMHGNRSQRIEIGLGLGVELFKGLGIGIGTEVVARAEYRINGTLDIAAGAVEDSEASTEDLIEYVRVDVHEMTLDLIPRFVPIAGVHWDLGELSDALKGAHVGASWRASSGVPVVADIDLQINGSLTGVGDFEPISATLVMPVELSIFDHFVPERLSMGVAHQYQSWPLVYVDVHHTQWSGMQVNVAHVTESAIRSQIFQVEEDLVDDANDYSVAFKNTWSVHGGAEVPLPVWSTDGGWGAIAVVLRGGAALIPSPLVSQDDRTAFLDADRVLLAGGFGVTHSDPFHFVPGPVTWDAFYTRQKLAEGELVSASGVRAGAPVGGQAIPVGGQLWSTGVQFSVSF